MKDVAEMKSEDANKKARKKPSGAYERPKVVRVSLRPEEAVLGHCKVAGSAGPVAASCRSLACKTVGS